MQQLRLFSENFIELKIIDLNYIKAKFMAIKDGFHEVLLEINSNKFLIRFSALFDRIEQLEIIAVKGFVELSIKVLKTLKKIVTKLYFDF